MGKFDLKNLETSLYRVVQSIFRYLELFRRDSRVCQTDRQTDSPVVCRAAKKMKFKMKVVGDVVRHIKRNRCLVCNELFHHDSASNILLSYSEKSTLQI